MNELELKAIIHDRVASIQTKKCLERVLKAIDKIQGEEEDWWDDLSDAQRVRLEQAIKEGRDSKNQIPYEVVKKKHAKWLSK